MRLSPRQRRFTPPLPLALASAISVALVSGQTSMAQVQPDVTAPAAASLPIELPAQPLGQALNELARQANLQMSFPAALVAGKTAPAVSGQLTVRQALDRVLEGSGLQAVVDGNAVVVRAAPIDSTATLPTVEVRSNYWAANTTEGRNNYLPEASTGATGLNLSLRETPQSVTVITQQEMKDQGMRTVADAMAATTGVSLKPYDSQRYQTNARGFVIANYMIDGIPVASGNIELDSDQTELYDRIEVIRGAAGLVSGAGQPSATINLVRKHATSRQFAGEVFTTIGSWNQLKLGADLSTPLNEAGTVRARVVASGERKDTAVDGGHSRGTLAYGVIDADLTPNTLLSVGASDRRIDRRGVMWFGWPFFYSDGSRTAFGRDRSTAASWDRWDTREQTAFAALRHRFGNGWSVTGEFDYRRGREYQYQLWSDLGTPDSITGLGLLGEAFDYFNPTNQRHAILTATGPFTLLGRSHQATLGFLHYVNSYSWDAAYSSMDGGIGLTELPNIHYGYGNVPLLPAPTRMRASSTRTSQTSVYGSAQIRITDALAVVPGGRVTNYRSENFPGIWATSYSSYRQRGVVTPYLGVLYDLNRSWTAYASYTESFNPQSNMDRNGKLLDPVTGRAQEIGIKGEWLDGTLLATASIFRILQENVAMADEGYNVPGTTDMAWRAARGVKSRGYELELIGRLTPRWQLRAGWTQYSARDAEGEDVLPHFPRKQFRLFTNYQFTGGWTGLTIGGGMAWDGTTPVQLENPVTGETEHVGQSAYALYNFMARYEVTKQTSLQLNIDNLFDKKYIFTNFRPSYLYGEPRRLTLTLRHRF